MFDEKLFFSLCDKYGVELKDKSETKINIGQDLMNLSIYNSSGTRLNRLQKVIKQKVAHGYPVGINLINEYNYITENEIITEKWNEEER